MNRALATALIVASASAANAGEMPTIKDFRLPDTAGKQHASADWTGKKAIVLIFMATDCPISNGYAPELKRLSADYTAKGVVVYGVHSDPDVTAEDAAKHAKEYGLEFPILLDAQQVVAKAAGAKKTPEAVVLTPNAKVVYRGRIDNKYEANGKRRDEPTERDLRNGLDAVLGGKPVPVAETKAVGCPIHFAKEPR